VPKVLSVASEIFPLIKTGGLADVAGALPAALARQGVRVKTLIPGYPAVLKRGDVFTVAAEIGELFGGPARLLAGQASGLDLFVIDAPHLYDRPGGPYSDQSGHDWPDNLARFAALGRVGASLCQGLIGSYTPDAIHAHDWQAGLAGAYLQFGETRPPRRVITVHNLAFQGWFPAEQFFTLGLPQAAFAMDGIEYYGGIGMLKAGLFYADRITTVSPTYADEICTPEYGVGLDGLLRRRAGDLYGILNGIDDVEWSPATDRRIAAQYDASHLDDRAANKPALQRQMGLRTDNPGPLFGVISRLTTHKGLDLLLDVLPGLLDEGGQLALVGTGEAALEAGFVEASRRYPGRVGVKLTYDEDLAHQIQAGCDALLVPSRFEPCGLTQLCALRYGAIPVVARVGGLADSVIDANMMALAAGVATGIQFAPVTAGALRLAVLRAKVLWGQPEVWRRLQMNGMATDVSWRLAARQYAKLYD
jgi:starch synthase